MTISPIWTHTHTRLSILLALFLMSLYVTIAWIHLLVLLCEGPHQCSCCSAQISFSFHTTHLLNIKLLVHVSDIIYLGYIKCISLEHHISSNMQVCEYGSVMCMLNIHTNVLHKDNIFVILTYMRISHNLNSPLTCTIPGMWQVHGDVFSR